MEKRWDVLILLLRGYFGKETLIEEEVARRDTLMEEDARRNTEVVEDPIYSRFTGF
jgi:hypothetical protein